jgi:hypothetical protein
VYWGEKAGRISEIIIEVFKNILRLGSGLGRSA